MSKAAELAALIGSGQAQGDKNLIINGAMQVAQYGANNLNITSASGGTFACDRFKFYLSLGGTAQFDLQQVAEAPTGSGFSNSLKVSCDVTDTLTSGNYLFIEYNIEGQDLQRIKKGTSDAESLTLSFWLKSNKTASGQVNVRDHDNTRLISKTYTVSSADTWQYVTLTFDGDTTGVITNDNTKGLSLEFFLDSGTTYSSGATPANWEALSAADRNATSFGLVSSTDNYWQITGIQLEVGDVAMPFEHESYAETLQKCQRYYERVEEADAFLGGGYNESTTVARAAWIYRVEKRTAATVDFSSGAALEVLGGASGADASTSIAVSTQKAHSVAVRPTTSSLTANDANLVRVVSGAWAAADAEL